MFDFTHHLKQSNSKSDFPWTFESIKLKKNLKKIRKTDRVIDKIMNKRKAENAQTIKFKSQ